MSEVYRNITGVVNVSVGSAIGPITMPTGVVCKGMCMKVAPGSGGIRITTGSGGADPCFTITAGDGISFSLMKVSEEHICYACAVGADTTLEVLLFD